MSTLIENLNRVMFHDKMQPSSTQFFPIPHVLCYDAASHCPQTAYRTPRRTRHRSTWL
ncbi:hypothetical protein PISMIDRAFT_684411 [Pisolithus microcarpus 441]|uniref:Uncharacterized protein n=1 Tax=Pisolithus microcarpus 441 TaxID=765257 RepID=A0A0C9Y0F1_9AGAM|nr:hypothetical protein PISMIDRAFT_684411 [Pisolithus microcarpus 441]